MRNGQPSVATEVLLGALAGLVGTAAMTAALRALHRRLPGPERYPLPPREIIRGVLPQDAERGIAEEHRQTLTMAAHFGYGAATGALYAVARPPASLGLGALYGVLVWGASYLGWIPGVRILRPATRHPAGRNGLMIAVHLERWPRPCTSCSAPMRRSSRAMPCAARHRTAAVPVHLSGTPPRGLDAERRSSASEFSKTMS